MSQTMFGHPVPRSSVSAPNLPGIGRLIAWTASLILLLDIGLVTEVLTLSGLGWFPEDLLGLIDRYPGPKELFRERISFVGDAGIRFGTFGFVIGLVLWWLFGAWFDRPARIPLYGAAAGAAGGLAGTVITTFLMLGIVETLPDLSGGSVWIVLWLIEGFAAGAVLGLALYQRLAFSFRRSEMWYIAWPVAFAFQQLAFGLALDQDDSANSEAILNWTLFVIGPLLVAVLLGAAMYLLFRGVALTPHEASIAITSEAGDGATVAQLVEDA